MNMKTDISLSPIKEKPINGSKEEAFFDSKVWLDSDCDDDFYSVNGEFTPSRGTTPVHHTFVIPLVNKNPSENVVPCYDPELPPTKKKKTLLDLFRESFRENRGDDMENTTDNEKKEFKQVIDDILPKSAHGTRYISRANSACRSEKTIDDDHVSIRGKSVKSAQRCFPSMGLCRSISERRKKTSPAIAANGSIN
ncbi:PREDICTED: uncharacterized protein At3g27210-like isoform X2 [Lupinus angustifolius]|uniref:uncharacterized protein At3g27210-like isoform X2 n=1 Tax=Lupinus angustifolius TaxID=3871 RepID=UPI00092E4384|nr:PREDICTED: uncharacterized protein At3g27210-like isoform X2 [Lupinus angustifolius]